MNNRFKFRIWHKPLKQMHYSDFILSPTGHLVPMFNQCDLDFDKQCKVMQCTGLKDKNGKLIYEGDIVKYICDSDWCADGYHQCIDCYSGENFKIYWNEDFCKFQYAPYDENEFNFDIDEDTKFCLEVIGNIYENKELLNENS